jgi:hypothetical protein
MSEPDPGRPLSYLTAVSLSESVLVVDDRRLDHVWHARNVGLTLERARRGLSGFVALDLQLAGSQTHASADLVYDAAAGRLSIDASLLQLWPSDMAAISEDLQHLAGLNFPVNGRITALVSAEGRMERIGFDIEAAEGELSVRDWIPEALPLRSASLEGELTQLGEERLVVRNAQVVLDPPEAPGLTLNARLTGRREETGTALRLEATMEDFKMPALPRVWPERIVDNGRTWLIENIPEGVVERVVLNGRMTLAGDDPSQAEVEALEGEFEFSDLEVHYFSGMPPVSNVDGRGTFDMAGVYMTPTSGNVGEIEVSGGKVDLLGFGSTDEVAAVEVDTRGPVPEYLELLSHPRLDLLSRLGLSPEGAEGSARVQANFTIPLVDALTFEEVDVNAEAQLSDVAVPGVLLGLDLTRGDLDLRVEKTRMRLQGPARIADVPLTFDWQENFSDGEELARRVQATVPELGEYGRDVLGLDAAPYLTGPIALDVDYKADQLGSGQVVVAADFTSAGLALPFMNWRKAPGQPAEGRGTVELEQEEIVHIGELQVEGERFRAEGDIYFASNGVPERLALSRFKAGESDLKELEVMRREGGLHLTIGEGQLDARPFLQELEEPEDAPDEPGAGQDEEADPPLLVEAPNLDPVIVGDGRSIRNASLKLERKSEEGWVLISLRGDVPGDLRTAPRKNRKNANGEPSSGQSAKPLPPVPIQFYYGPDGNEGVALSADSEDFGATLRVFDLLESIEGGQFQLRGGRPPNQPDKPLKATLQVSEFTMVEAPVMARILSVASLTGASDLLSGEGIRFTEASGDLKVKKGKVSSDLLRAHGPALGLTAKGEVDLVADAIDVEGTVVPAYSVNRILGEIPLLGRVLTGGEGEGVVAVTYKVSGPVSDPKVSVNPLSVLTPGFLRGVFNLFEGGAAPKDNDISVYPPAIDTP